MSLVRFMFVFGFKGRGFRLGALKVRVGTVEWIRTLVKIYNSQMVDLKMTGFWAALPVIDVGKEGVCVKNDCLLGLALRCVFFSKMAHTARCCKRGRH